LVSAFENISNVLKFLGTRKFAAFGCVFSPQNFRNVVDIVKFATEIGWWVSLVPAHSTSPTHPRAFSTFNDDMSFNSKDYSEALEIIDAILQMKHDGFNVYDSDQFLLDMKNFVTKKPLTWRDRNGGVCDAGSLYFAVMPDGSLAPCCDWRMNSLVQVQHQDFPKQFIEGMYSKEIVSIASSCNGCLYGSYPEISISARYAQAALERVKLFKAEKNSNLKPYSADTLKQIASRIATKNGQ